MLSLCLGIILSISCGVFAIPSPPDYVPSGFQFAKVKYEGLRLYLVLKMNSLSKIDVDGCVTISFSTKNDSLNYNIGYKAEEDGRRLVSSNPAEWTPTGFKFCLQQHARTGGSSRYWLFKLHNSGAKSWKWRRIHYCICQGPDQSDQNWAKIQAVCEYHRN